MSRWIVGELVGAFEGAVIAAPQALAPAADAGPEVLEVQRAVRAPQSSGSGTTDKITPKGARLPGGRAQRVAQRRGRAPRPGAPRVALAHRAPRPVLPGVCKLLAPNRDVARVHVAVHVAVVAGADLDNGM